MPKTLPLCPSFTAGGDHVAPNALRSLIGENDVTRPIGYRHSDRQCSKDQVQKLLALPHHILRSFAFGNVLKAIHGADQFSLSVSQGCNIHQSRYARSVGPLYHYFHIVSRDSCPERLRHSRFLVRHELSVRRPKAQRGAITLRCIPRFWLASP